MQTFPGAVAGFRIMKLKPEGVGPPMMLSIGGQLSGAEYEWQPHKRNVMVCGRQNEHRGQRPPVWGCRCGFWFYKNLPDLKMLVPPQNYNIGDGAWCLVAGWGKVVEHEIGVRTEFARPLALMAERPPTQTSNRLDYKKWLRWIEMIGLPVISEDEIQLAATTYKVDLLQRTEPVTLEQWLTPSGFLAFVTLGPDGHTPEQPLPEGSARLPDGKVSWVHDQIKEYLAEMPDGRRYRLRLEKFFDESRRAHFYWTTPDADHDTMLHNHAQIQRALRSPNAALYKA